MLCWLFVRLGSCICVLHFCFLMVWGWTEILCVFHPFRPSAQHEMLPIRRSDSGCIFSQVPLRISFALKFFSLDFRPSAHVEGPFCCFLFLSPRSMKCCPFFLICAFGSCNAVAFESCMCSFCFCFYHPSQCYWEAWNAVRFPGALLPGSFFFFCFGLCPGADCYGEAVYSLVRPRFILVFSCCLSHKMLSVFVSALDWRVLSVLGLHSVRLCLGDLCAFGPDSSSESSMWRIFSVFHSSLTVACNSQATTHCNAFTKARSWAPPPPIPVGISMFSFVSCLLKDQANRARVHNHTALVCFFLVFLCVVLCRYGQRLVPFACLVPQLLGSLSMKPRRKGRFGYPIVVFVSLDSPWIPFDPWCAAPYLFWGASSCSCGVQFFVCVNHHFFCLIGVWPSPTQAVPF